MTSLRHGYKKHSKIPLHKFLMLVSIRSTTCATIWWFTSLFINMFTSKALFTIRFFLFSLLLASHKCFNKSYMVYYIHFRYNPTKLFFIHCYIARNHKFVLSNFQIQRTCLFFTETFCTTEDVSMFWSIQLLIFNEIYTIRRCKCVLLGRSWFIILKQFLNDYRARSASWYEVDPFAPSSARTRMITISLSLERSICRYLLNSIIFTTMKVSYKKLTPLLTEHFHDHHHLYW